MINKFHGFSVLVYDLPDMTGSYSINEGTHIISI